MSEERGARSRKWYETLEQADLQARTRLSDERFAEWQNLRAWQQEQQQPMSDSHRAWQQQLQQAEMQAQAAAEAQAQRADEPDLPERWRDHCADQERAIAALHEAIDIQSKTIAELRAQMSDPPQSEQPATDTSAGAVQRRIDDVCQDLVLGRTSDAQRRGLGGAVERAGRVSTGSDAAVGRIARLSRGE